jgi:hypothetical protein
MTPTLMFAGLLDERLGSGLRLDLRDLDDLHLELRSSTTALAPKLVVCRERIIGNQGPNT